MDFKSMWSPHISITSSVSLKHRSTTSTPCQKFYDLKGLYDVILSSHTQPFYPVIYRILAVIKITGISIGRIYSINS